MKTGRVLVGMAFGFVLLCSTTVYAETAQQAFAKGNALLEEGSFQEALQAR